jgi:hypothetical protein
MPVFYLHQRRGGTVIRDHEGAEFPNVEHAQAEAVIAARELMGEMMLTGLVDLTPVFEISDEAGATIEVPFASAVRFRHALDEGK